MGVADERPNTGIRVDEYLEGEQATEVKHEYVGGTVYAMGGASREHNIIAGNLFAVLHGHLRGGPCQTFMADMKVHLRLGEDEIFYYPDVAVGCEPDDRARYYLERPRFIAEVASPATERVDRREKLLAYTRLEDLESYLILEQDRPAGLLHRRSADWSAQSLAGGDHFELPGLDITLAIDELYAGALA